eukprot:5892359-Pleurochrysis_carterae.AAC.1
MEKTTKKKRRRANGSSRTATDKGAATVRKKLRLPYKRAQAASIVPLVKRASHWCGVIAGAFREGEHSA